MERALHWRRQRNGPGEGARGGISVVGPTDSGRYRRKRCSCRSRASASTRMILSQRRWITAPRPVVSHRQNETYPVPVLYVENTAQALLDLAGGYRRLCGGKVVGVTGSVGKTTTKELLFTPCSGSSSAHRKPKAT